jgi:hypothetical protein
VAGGKEAFDRKLEALSALRANPGAPETTAQLRRALKDRSNYVVSKAVAIIADLRLEGMIPDLLTAFDRSLIDGAKTDPQCWAKNAIVKALKKHDRGLADAVYSGVPAHLFGLEQIVEVGPMSGKSNVLYWLARHNIPASDELVNRIYEAAKQSPRVLTDGELHALCATSGAPV